MSGKHYKYKGIRDENIIIVAVQDAVVFDKTAVQNSWFDL
jgi:hypothetical protein